MGLVIVTTRARSPELAINKSREALVLYMKGKSNKLTLERIDPMSCRGIVFRPVSLDRLLCQTDLSRFWDS